MTDPEPTAAVAPAILAALAADLRYVLNYTGPRHAHEQPGIWDSSGKRCEHCARLNTARQNLAIYDADPAAVLLPAAAANRAAALEEFAGFIRGLRLTATATSLEDVETELRHRAAAERAAAAPRRAQADGA